MTRNVRYDSLYARLSVLVPLELAMYESASHLEALAQVEKVLSATRNNFAVIERKMNWVISQQQHNELT